MQGIIFNVVQGKSADWGVCGVTLVYLLLKLLPGVSLPFLFHQRTAPAPHGGIAYGTTGHDTG